MLQLSYKSSVHITIPIQFYNRINMLFIRCQELSICLFIICLAAICVKRVAEGLLAYPRGSSQGVSQLNKVLFTITIHFGLMVSFSFALCKRQYLAALAMPIDLPNRNLYMAFNFEASFGLPPNDSYYYWVDRVIYIYF